jgi:hypothetical protein
MADGQEKKDLDWRNFAIRAAVALISFEFVLLVLRIGFAFRKLPWDQSLANFFYLPNLTNTEQLTLFEVLVMAPAVMSLLSRSISNIFWAPVGMAYAMHLYKLPVGDAFPESVGEFTMLIALAAVVAITSTTSPIFDRWIK